MMFRMLTYKRVKTKITARKHRLFACACSRCCWDLLTGRSRAAVEVAEKFADGLATNTDLLKAHLAAQGEVWRTRDGVTSTRQERTASMAVAHLTLLRERPYENPDALSEITFQNGHLVAVLTKNAARKDLGWQKDWSRQVRLLRDIFGNPFRRMKLDPAWQTGTVVSLATAIYAERAFERMAILGDALEEAGCADIDILTHCRTGGEHVFGCWLVDVLLGKE
ncbi:hypothetical protein AYO44_05170 [Planctomycetaceae bacterium SCGC AG-212-F19]|nr:hypothetical protein AYO44_05170 [Planctomycetaceae bacterium SCGC AG-212-F19]